ncbi:photosynthetic complex putative assembly protein PuhB [Sphingomonas qilianensis]|uniref:Photosynthetic complex putative assembly protein PuhB n=1 Tax=Sphingomonas qilianensis TaxID=1736690 RepID=A0ABU9XWM2_9SPHN
MIEYDNEPIPGLPGVPPPGERILWQGAPDWRVLARTAFHTRLVAGYFALLALWAVASAGLQGIRSPGDLIGAAMTVIAGIVGVALLHLLAWGTARTTLYTLTNRRVVLRIGMALPKCINLPLKLIGAVDLAQRRDGFGDVPLTLTGTQSLGFVALWPHARPWKIVAPQPMLRALPEAATVAALIGRHCLAAHPDGQLAVPESATQQAPAFAEAQAA